jgi:hypothetical protein
VSRHEFLPGHPLEDAYSRKPVVTQRAPDGSLASSASSPNLVAQMLKQLRVAPGNPTASTFVFRREAGTWLTALVWHPRLDCWLRRQDTWSRARASRRPLSAKPSKRPASPSIRRRSAWTCRSITATPKPGRARIGFAFTPRTWDGEPVNAEPDKRSELVWATPSACRPTPSATPPP